MFEIVLRSCILFLIYAKNLLPWTKVSIPTMFPKERLVDFTVAKMIEFSICVAYMSRCCEHKNVLMEMDSRNCTKIFWSPMFCMFAFCIGISTIPLPTVRRVHRCKPNQKSQEILRKVSCLNSRMKIQERWRAASYNYPKN